MRTVLLMLLVGSLFAAGCSEERSATVATSPGTGADLESDDALPGSLWNDGVVHADGDSILATPGAEGVLGSAGVGQYTSFPWSWHLPFRGSWYMTCGPGLYMHTGNDYYATDWAVSGNPCGLDVLAPGAGWVMWAGYKSGYGYTVLIEAGPTGQSNGNRYVYRVAHLSRIDVVPGWWLPQGYRIGTHGGSGGNYICHLHWVVYRGQYTSNGNVNGSSFPVSYSTGVDGFNGGRGPWVSKM